MSGLWPLGNCAVCGRRFFYYFLVETRVGHRVSKGISDSAESDSGLCPENPQPFEKGWRKLHFACGREINAVVIGRKKRGLRLQASLLFPYSVVVSVDSVVSSPSSFMRLSYVASPYSSVYSTSAASISSVISSMKVLPVIC